MTPPDGCPGQDQCELGSLAALKQDHQKWHLSREVSVTHIITTLAAMAAFIAWAMKQNDRITTLENNSIVALRVDEDQTRERKELKNEIREELKEIRRLIEGMQKR